MELKSEEKPVILKKFETEKKGSNLKLIVIGLVVVLVGVGSGYLLSTKSTLLKPKAGTAINTGGVNGGIAKGMTVGIADEKTFKDSAEGKLEAGGANGEGSHHLVRPGGDSQNVYLTSSTVDLDRFIGRQVKVWGETFAAKRAGWLMDVGKLQVLD